MLLKFVAGARTQYMRTVSLRTHARAMSTNFTPPDLRPTHKPFEPEGLVDDHKILQPYKHLEQSVGKNTRPRLIEAFNHWLKVPHDKLDTIQQISEMLHNHFLLLDDIEDETPVRREAPVAQAIYGIGSTVNSTNYVAHLALQKAIELGKLEAVQVCIEQCVDILRGMGLELYWRDLHKYPTEEEFIEMTWFKIAATVRVPIRLMQLFSTSKLDLTKFIIEYSLYIQIKDDYTDLFANDRLEIKEYCEDVTEGKYSLPILHAINKENDDKVLGLIQKRPKDMGLKKYTMDLLKKHGSVEYTLQTLRKYDKSTREEVAKLGGNPKFEAILDEYAYLLE